MTLTSSSEQVGASALSCLSANLAEYLAATVPDPLRRIATTVRLAVRLGRPCAFAQHAEDLGRLGPDRALRYASADDPAAFVAHLERLVRADGQALFVGYAGSMSWSLAAATDAAPHLVRLAGRDGDRWDVDDRFSALLPAGVQQSFRGDVPTADLLRAATPPEDLAPEQSLRKEHAIGVPIPLPAGRFQWLESTAEPAPEGGVREPEWIVETEAVLDYLTEFFGDFTAHPERARLVDDMWAAAQHHTFRYAHLLAHAPLRPDERKAAEAAREAWNDLPLALFYAANAAARGKPRPAVVPKAFGAVRDGERRCADTVRRHGYGS